MTRQSLYGLRGVRIGVASHSVPRHKRRRRVVASSETTGSEPEATLLDALEQDLVGSPEVPATHVDPTPLGFTPEDGSGRPRLASGRAHGGPPRVDEG